VVDRVAVGVTVDVGAAVEVTVDAGWEPPEDEPLPHLPEVTALQKA